MKQISSTTLQYHDKTYDLAKFEAAGIVEWRVYDYSINGRGSLVFGFTDAAFSQHQAEHMAKHMLRLYNRGWADGRSALKQAMRDLVDDDIV